MNAAFQDGNWILNKVFSVMGKTSSPKEVAKAVLRSACFYAMQLECTGSVVFFDGSRNFRYAVYPEYKSNRGPGGEHDGEDSGKDDMYSCLDTIFRLFHLVRFPIYQIERYEADDLCSAAAVYHAGLNKKNFSWIVNQDKDAFQTVRHNINVFWPKVGKLGKDQKFNDGAVWTRTGFYPENFGEFQILTGDSVDCIPAIVKPAMAKKIINEHRSLKNYFSTPEGKKFFLANEKALRRNRDLVRMDLSSWDPESMTYDLSKMEETKTCWTEFGELPGSFHALKVWVNTSKKRSLF